VWLLALDAALGAAPVATADLQAALRSLGFLQSLQNRSAVVIAVIYNGSDTASRAQAQWVAAELTTLPGPGSARVTVNVVAAQDLAQSSQHFDALYLMPLPAEASRSAGDYVRRQSVISISSDPACLETQSCVLLVQARSSLSIVLDTALARAVGAKFSTVFTMLVKRR
jgi:hypothetical protein